MYYLIFQVLIEYENFSHKITISPGCFYLVIATSRNSLPNFEDFPSYQ